jgi:hypothetical protein
MRLNRQAPSAAYSAFRASLAKIAAPTHGEQRRCTAFASKLAYCRASCLNSLGSSSNEDKAQALVRSSQFLDLARESAELAAQAAQDALHSRMPKRIPELACSGGRTARNIPTMNFNGTLTDRQLFSDLAACQALSNQAIDLSLPRRQIRHCPPPWYNYVRKTAKIAILFLRPNSRCPARPAPAGVQMPTHR